MMISLNSTIALVLAVVVVLLLMMTTVSFVVVVNAFSSVGQLPRATRTTIPSSSSSLFKDNNNNYHHSCRSNTISTDCRRRQTLSLSLSGRATNTELSDDETACAEVDVLRQQAEQLKAKAKAIRDELDQTDTKAAASSETKVSTTSSTPPKRSPFDLPPPTSSDAATAAEYRLSVDIGREDGTWMDPRWGSSGRRIEFTVDVRFIITSSDNNDVDAVVSDEYKKAMVKDNFGGKSSQVRSIVSSPAAKLNRGFDSMKCHGGAYRIDLERNGKGTVRFHLLVDGYDESSGDVSIPQGYLYFSIPVFNNRMTMLSQKPGPVTVRQVGWHTGWRREESRMVGTFKAVPLQQS